MRSLKDLGTIIFITVFYFCGVTFAVAALVPELAVQAGLIAAMLSMIAYIILVVIGRDEPGLPLGLLMLLPIICITAGIIWWMLRLLGLWEV